MLADLLSDLSLWTWAFLRDAPFRPREETITETLLTEFSRRGSGDVLVRKSTIAEEHADGLDWAWASPCAYGQVAAGAGCGAGAGVLSVNPGGLWRYASAAEWGTRPAPADFLDAGTD